jgi:hypothetical protein
MFYVSYPFKINHRSVQPFRVFGTPSCSLVNMYGRHPLWTDGAQWYSDACRSLGLEHYRYRFGEWLHTVMERSIQFLKDRVERFDNALRRDAAYNTSGDG